MPENTDEKNSCDTSIPLNNASMNVATLLLDESPLHECNRIISSNNMINSLDVDYKNTAAAVIRKTVALEVVGLDNNDSNDEDNSSNDDWNENDYNDSSSDDDDYFTRIIDETSIRLQEHIQNEIDYEIMKHNRQHYDVEDDDVLYDDQDENDDDFDDIESYISRNNQEGNDENENMILLSKPNSYDKKQLLGFCATMNYIGENIMKDETAVLLNSTSTKKSTVKSINAAIQQSIDKFRMSSCNEII